MFTKVSTNLNSLSLTLMILWRTELKTTSRLFQRQSLLIYLKNPQLILLTNSLRCKKSGSQLNPRNLRVRTMKLREQLKILFKQSVHINLTNMSNQFQPKKFKNFQSITTGQCIKHSSTQLSTLSIK